MNQAMKQAISDEEKRINRLKRRSLDYAIYYMFDNPTKQANKIFLALMKQRKETFINTAELNQRMSFTHIHFGFALHTIDKVLEFIATWGTAEEENYLQEISKKFKADRFRNG